MINAKERKTIRQKREIVSVYGVTETLVRTAMKHLTEKVIFE